MNFKNGGGLQMSKRSIPEEMPLGLEDVVLGKILNDPACLPVLSRGLKDGSYFSDELFGEYYDAFLECFANHGTVDIMLVEPYLDKRNLPLGDLGRFERAAAKAGGQGEDYVERIWAAHKRKGRTEQLEAWLVELRSCADQGSFDSLTARMVAELMKDGPSGDNRIKTMKEVAVEISDEIDLVCSGNKALGLPFGFNSIDPVVFM
jgi:replicative DNA helicase